MTIIPAAMEATMISRVASMTLCRSRGANCRAQREVAVCEVAPDSDRLSCSIFEGAPTPQPDRQTAAPGFAVVAPTPVVDPKLCRLPCRNRATPTILHGAFQATPTYAGN